MPGGLLQLVSCSDDKLLIDNLNFSHFKIVYKTAYPFSFQDLNIKFKCPTKFGTNHNLKIPNYGDLLQNLTMYVELPKLEAKYNNDIPTEILLNKDMSVYNLSTNNINYILERLNDFTYFPFFENNNIINIYNWLDNTKELKKSNIYQKIKDYEIVDKTFISPIDQDINNILINELNQLCYNYENKKNDIYNFYYPLHIQYLLHLLLVDDTRKIMTSTDYYQLLIDKINNYIISNQEMKLIQYLEEKQQNYIITSLDNQIYNEKVIINLIVNINNICNIEPLMYFYKKTIINDNIKYELSDILVNKSNSITNFNYIIKTEKYTNNDYIIENQIISNTFNNKIYFIGSRPQIINSQDLLQILRIRFIKSRDNKNIIFTNNPNEAIEWEIKILYDTSTLNLPNLNDGNKYLMYIYNGLSPEDQDIIDFQGKYIIDNSQKKYFVDKNDNYIPITAYIQDLSQTNKNKSYIPLLTYENLHSDVDLRYNKKYFLDTSLNFIEIKEIYIDENGKTGIIISLNDSNYYVDNSGNYIGPILSYEDISGNYILDITADFIIDLIGNVVSDITINDQTDISNNLVPIYDFVNKGKGFKYVYKGKYYNYLNLYKKRYENKPTNLIDGFPYLLPFSILELSTYNNDIIILKKINLSGINDSDVYYHTSELLIKNNNINKFVIYGNNLFNINDISNNILTLNENYIIKNQEVYLNNNFIYYWNNNNLIDQNGVNYMTYEYWQENNIPYEFTININNVNNYKFIPISNIKYEYINYDVYENYKYIIKTINNLNLESYEIYNMIINNISSTININFNIFNNIFTNLFSSNYFFSQYVITNSTVISLQSKLITEHVNKYLKSIIGTYENNVFVDKIYSYWNEFIEVQDLLFFKVMQIASNDSYNIIKILKNNESMPTLKVRIKLIANEILLKKNINLVLANSNDISNNALKLSNNNFFDNNENIKKFINNENYNNINISDINILKSLNIFSDNELTNLSFSFNNWTILEYEKNDIYFDMFIVPPNYQEFKKFLALLYYTKSSKNNLSFYIIFDITGSEAVTSFINDKIRLIYSYDYFPDDYITKQRNVIDIKNRNVFLNTIIIDFYKYLINKIINKITNEQFLLYAKIYFYNNLWHLIQDILHTTIKGNSSMSTLASAGNILIINNFSNYYDQVIINHIITNLFNNYFEYNIKSKCIYYLNNKSFISSNNKLIRFYSISELIDFNPTYTDIELTNINSIEVLQWLIYYLCNKLENYYLPDRKSRDSDINFWNTFDNYKLQIFNGASLNNINFFLYHSQNEFFNDKDQLAEIYYVLNEVMMNIYSILNEETINDTVNNTTYKIVTINNNNGFGNIININNYSIYNILTDYLIQVLKQYYNNYTYNYLLEYFNTTKINFLNLYNNIFNNVHMIGLSSYNMLRDIETMSGFNWNTYDLKFPRINPYYNNLIDNNLQVSSTFTNDKFYFKYDIFFRNKIINFINNIYIYDQNIILNNYNKYKKLLKLNTADETNIINNYISIFGNNLSNNLYSTKEFKKAIEWEIFNEFSIEDYKLKIINNILGLYDNSNNQILNYTSIGIVNGNNNLLYIIDNGIYKDLNNNIQPYYIYNYDVYNIDLNNVSNPIYKYINNNNCFDISNNLIYIIYNNKYYPIINKLYEIINNKIIDTNFTILEKIIYDKNTKIVHYLLNQLEPSTMRNIYDISDNLFVTNIINNVFNSTITLNDLIFDINKQLYNTDFTNPILLNLILRNSILPCNESWEANILISFWNNIVSSFGLTNSVFDSINNYNNINQYKQIKLINNSFCIDYYNTYSYYNNNDIITNIHFSIEKEIDFKQKFYLTLSNNEINKIKELDEVKIEIKKLIFNNIYNNKNKNNYFIINNKKYWYIGELITDDEKILLDSLNLNIDQNVNETLKILNGELIRLSNLPFGYKYNYIDKTIKYEYKINNILAMSYYKWNNYNFKSKNKSYNIIDITNVNNIIQNENIIYITVNNTTSKINDYIVIYKLYEIYGPMKIIDVSNNILQVEVNDGFIFENNYNYKIGYIDNYNNISWKSYYKQYYTPIKISDDIIIILQSFFNNIIVSNLPDIFDVSGNLINIVNNLTDLSNIFNTLPSDINTIYNDINDISNNLITINKNLSFVPTLYNNMSNLMNIKNNIESIINYTSYYSTIVKTVKNINITQIKNESVIINNYGSLYLELINQCDFIAEFLTNTNLLKSTFYPLRKFFNEQNNGEIVTILNNLETIFSSVILPTDLSENIVLFVDNIKTNNTIYLNNLSDTSNNLTLYSIINTYWKNLNKQLDTFNNNIGNLYLTKDISKNIINFFNINDNVQNNIQNITELANYLETNNIDDIIKLLKNTSYLQNIINSLHSLNTLNDIINIFLKLGTPFDIIYRDVNDYINNTIDSSLNTITNEEIINKLIYIISDSNNIKNKINESINILNELSLISDIINKIKLLKNDILEINNFMSLFPIITTLARSMPDLKTIIEDKEVNIPFIDLFELLQSSKNIIESFRTLYTGITTINSNLSNSNTTIINKLNFIVNQTNKINQFSDLSRTINIVVNLMNTYATNNNLFDNILYNNISLRKNINNFTNLFNNYFCNNIENLLLKLPIINNCITYLPTIDLFSININIINNSLNNINIINEQITNINNITFTYENYNIEFVNFGYMIDNINNFIKYINNIDDFINLNNILKDFTINNTLVLYNNLNDIYRLININQCLIALENFLDNFSDFKYKILQWLNKDNNSIFLICKDENNYIDFYDWVYLNDSNPLFIIDKYDINLYKIVKITWNTNDFNYDKNQIYILRNGIGHMIDNLNILDKLDTNTLLDIYFTKINFNDIIKKYNINNLIYNTDISSYKKNLLLDIIQNINNDSPLIKLPNDKISKIYNQHFNNIKFIDYHDNIISQFNINLQKKINNIIKLNNIINRPIKPRISWIKFIGHYLFSKINFRINDYTLQELTSDWIHIWSHISMNNSKYDGYYKMIGNIEKLYNYDSTIKNKTNLYIPLPFYFQNKYHLALPLIALQNSELIFEVTTRKLNELIYIEDGASIIGDLKLKFELIGNFVYLSDYERELFSKMRHEYLIEQTQYCYENISLISSGNIKLNFMNPIKDIFFIIQDNKKLYLKQYDKYETYFKNISLNFNGHDRFSNVESYLTSLVYPHTYYEKTFLDGVNVYPFCLYPLTYQPSGSCSFTYLNNKLFKYNLNKKIDNGIIKIYARSYSILRITSGIGSIFI